MYLCISTIINIYNYISILIQIICISTFFNIYIYLYTLKKKKKKSLHISIKHCGVFMVAGGFERFRDVKPPAESSWDHPLPPAELVRNSTNNSPPNIY